MTEDQELKDMVSRFNDEVSRRADEQVAAWTEEHLPELKQQYVSGQRLLYQSLVVSFVVGLAAHVGGYVLLLSAQAGLLGLLADLLHAFGWSLWTGAVVAVFLQVAPEVKRRQIKQAVDAYEALRRKKAHAVDHRDGAAASERPNVRAAARKKGQTCTRNRAQRGG